MTEAAPKSPTLGRLLIDRGWITQEQLADALARQKTLGGHLGTALLEIGALSEDLLIRVLSEQLDVPAADIEDLRGISPELVGKLPAKVAVRARAVPFRVRRGRVHVAMLEVHDLELQDELSFILGKAVQAHIANEARIFEALATYYGKSCPTRIESLLERLNRKRDRWKKSSPAPAAPEPAPAVRPATSPAEAAPRQRPSLAAVPEPSQVSRRPVAPAKPKEIQRSIPLSEEERRSLQQLAASAPATPESSTEVADPAPQDRARLLASFRERLAGASATGEIGELLLGALSQEFVRCLLFRVARGVVTGWMSAAPDLPVERFRGFSTNLVQPSIFKHVADSGGIHLGPLPAQPPHRQLVALWRGDLRTECMVTPVQVRDRLVCLVYGDRDALGVAGVDIGLVQQLVGLAAGAMERLILERRKGAGRPPAGA